MQRYEKYKDSGVDWIGEIPESWNSVKLKYLIKSRTGFAFPSEKFEDEGIPLVRIGDLDVSGKVILTKCPRLPIKFSNFLEVYGLKRNDLLFAMTGGTIGKVAIFEEDSEALLNQRVCSFTIIDNNLRRIVYNWMQTYYWKNYINLKASGGAQPNISDVDVLELKIVIPDLISEQQTIANFLDDKTGKIDQTIAIKQKEIELLKERRQILIQKAVTKGLDDNVPLKDSGVDWIGEIPEHWDSIRIKQCSKKISKGTTPSTEGREILLEGEVRFIKSENIFEGFIVDNPVFFIDKKTDFIMRRSSLKANDVLFVIAGASLGKVAIVTADVLPANTNQAVAFVRPNNKIHPLFLSKFLVSNTIRELTWLDAVQSAQPNLSMENLGNFPVSFPPIQEQIQIVLHLEEIEEKIAKAILLKQQEIEKLKEYKTVLIDQVVTGKVRVN